MVYVSAAETYEEALDFAQTVYPELQLVDRSQISFNIRVVTGSMMSNVQIGSMAWTQVVSNLTRFEVIDVGVAKPLTAPRTVIDPPPQYPMDEKARPSLDKEKDRLDPNAESPRRSRSPSPTSSKWTSLFRTSSQT